MAADGKMQALNNAIRETLPHLVDVADQNPHAELLVRAIAFSTGARWHIEQPTPVDQLEWEDLTTGGYTDLGAALDLLAPQLGAAAMEERALPPAIVLISDGMPTDDYKPALGRFLDEPWGAERCAWRSASAATPTSTSSSGSSAPGQRARSRPTTPSSSCG